MNREIMQQALDALKNTATRSASEQYATEQKAIAAALEAELAKPVNEFNPDWDQQAVLVERIRELEAQLYEQAENQEPDLPPVEIGVDVTEHGTTVVAFYRRPNAVMEMFYSQFHPQPKQPKNPSIRIQNHSHTDHPMQHWDRTCPACVAEQKPSRCQACGGALPVTGRLDRTGECDCIEPLANPIANQPETSGSPMPVAWISRDNRMTCYPDRIDESWTPLYTAPPRKEWVGLTDEEIKELLDCKRGGLVDIKKAEQILKEKNA